VSRKPTVNEAAVIAFRDAAEFDAWLAKHVDLPAGVWLKIAKKGSGVADRRRGGRARPVLRLDLRPAQALQQGLLSTEVRAPPPTQPVVASQCGQGRGADQGRADATVRLAEVEAAKADGRWAAAYQSQRNATVPTRSRRRPGGEPAGGASVRRAQQEPAVCGDPTSYRPHRHRPRRPAPQSHDRARSMQRLVN
jgi:hypothetical protein